MRIFVNQSYNAYSTNLSLSYNCISDLPPNIYCSVYYPLYKFVCLEKC